MNDFRTAKWFENIKYPELVYQTFLISVTGGSIPKILLTKYLYSISDNEPFRIVGEGRIITTEAAAQSTEGFRNPNKEIQ